MASEYVEVRLLIPESKIDEFLQFCEERLDTMPAVHRIPREANGYEIIEEIENEGAEKREPASS